MENLTDKITARLNEMRQYLQADGGDLEIVSIDGKLVRLKLREDRGGGVLFEHPKGDREEILGKLGE